MEYATTEYSIRAIKSSAFYRRSDIFGLSCSDIRSDTQGGLPTDVKGKAARKAVPKNKLGIQGFGDPPPYYQNVPSASGWG